MATIFVNSGATGTNAGTSWTDAFTSLASTSAAAAGDKIKVHKTHTQTGLVASINWASGTAVNPVQIVCVDKDAGDVLATGAIVEWTSSALGPIGNIFAYGMVWKSTSGSFAPASGTDGIQTHENCTWVLTGSGALGPAGSRSTHIWKNVNVDLSAGGASAVGFNYSGASRFEWTGGTYTVRTAGQTNLLAPSGTLGTNVLIRGVTFAGTVTNFFNGSAAALGNLLVHGCIPPTFTTLIATAGINEAFEYALDGVVSGILTAALLPPTNRTTARGTVKALTSRYRAGGAADGSQPNEYSWEMASNALAGPFAAPLRSPPISRWVASGAQTVTVYVASGVTLTNEEFWIEVYSPSEAGSPAAPGVYRTSRVLPLGTPANLVTDSVSTWTGTGVGTKQKVAVAISPTIAGPLVVRVHLAKASVTVYVDPGLVVT